MAKKSGKSRVKRTSKTTRHAPSKRTASSKPARSAGAAKAPGSRKKSTASGGSRAPSTVARDQALSLLAFSHKMISDMLSGVPAEQCTAQSGPVTNHVLWTLGHVAMTNDWLASLIDGRPGAVPKAYESLFGMGSVPVVDTSKYPSLAEVRAEFDRGYERLVSAAKKRNDAELLTPPLGNSFGFTNNKLDSVLKAAWHEGWHIGQIADLRRGLGIKPMMS